MRRRQTASPRPSPPWLVWPDRQQAAPVMDPPPDEPQPKAKRQPATWRAMSDMERRAILAAQPGFVSYCPGSATKRLMRNLAAQAASDAPQITDKQAAAVWQIVWRYRRQVKDPDVLNVAREKMAS